MLAELTSNDAITGIVNNKTEIMCLPELMTTLQPAKREYANMHFGITI